MGQYAQNSLKDVVAQCFYFRDINHRFDEFGGLVTGAYQGSGEKGDFEEDENPMHISRVVVHLGV